MKKRLIWLLILVVICTAVMFVGCVGKPQVPDNNPQDSDEKQQDKVSQDVFTVIVKGTFTTTVTLKLGNDGVKAETVEQVLQYFIDNEILTVHWSDGDYGKFITGIGGLKAEGKQFVSVYTSVVEQQGSWAGVTSVTHNGVTLVASAVGVSEMVAKNGATILFQLETY